MHSFVAFIVGIMCAWAFPKGKYPPLGKWRPLAGGVAAIFPHIEEAFLLFGNGKEFYIQFAHSITWNPFLAPIYSLLLAVIFGQIAKRDWQIFFPITLVSMLFSIFLAIFTFDGVKIFYPLGDLRIAFESLYSFDLTILSVALLVIVLDFILPRWGKDISRIGIVIIVIYIGVITTFSWRAEDIAKQYAKALSLDVVSIDTLPQPISPMNWRLIITTTDNRLHDSMININRKEEKIITESSNRASKINALYKPVNKAIWRIYKRFGKGEQTKFIQDTWQDQPAWLRNYTRFDVFRKLNVKSAMPCVEFKDIRTLGARKLKSGIFSVCKKANGNYIIEI